jgi:N-acetylglucosaminyl-diphospho-decaprenol L-rhamnosyltransferase
VRIGVIVVSHRSRRHLPDCLTALAAALDGLDHDVLVVDNASDDDTRSWLQDNVDARRLVLHSENRGFAVAVNQAAAGVAADALLLLNPDTVIDPGALRRLVRELAGDPAIGAAGPQLLFPDGSPQPSAWRVPGAASLAFEALMLYNLFPRSRLHAWEPAGGESEDVPCLSGACLLVRRACWDVAGGFDERFFLYYEDMDFSVRARRAGFRLRLVPEARVIHDRGGSSFQDRRQFLYHFHESRRRFLRKHHGPVYGGLLAGMDGAGLALRAVAHFLRGRWTGRRELLDSAADHRAALRTWLSGRGR